MRSTLVMLVLALELPAQAGEPARPQPGGLGTVVYDSRGWPVVPGEQEPAPAARTESTPPAAPPGAAVPATEARAFASGMALGSPLLDVYQHTRSPAAFRALGGVVVWWRLSIFGAQGEVLGTREVTHTADCAFAERDRLEHADGRVFGRSGASVFAERQGMPWPTLNEAAAQELMLFGLHLRVPWCFGDAGAYAVTGRSAVDGGGELRTRIALERRSTSGGDLIGPPVEAQPRDRYELICEASSGQPRELVHRFANTQQARRVLLEDWRDVAFGETAVRLPFRRVYVDEQGRPTTSLEIVRIETARVTERDFRLR